MITAEQIREAFDYHPETGTLVWRKSKHQTRNGTEAGNVDPTTGHMRIWFNGRLWQYAKIAWLHYYGEYPTKTPDHKDNDPLNNQINNLRLATKSQNAANSKLNTRNSTGLKGVSFIQRTGKFYASICINQRTLNLGQYNCKFEAHAAYIAAAEKYFGEFARPHG